MTKRSLILAGGGMKVGYQAGAMQVLLDEAGLEFDHFDATSGGCFNLAMLQSGLNGAQIADTWRNYRPITGMGFHWFWRYLLPWRLPSLLTYSRFRKRVLRSWGIDFGKIRQSTIDGTYNVYNFSDKRPEVLTGSDLEQELFLACVSLPIFFPVVNYKGKNYFDGVFYKDANLSEAVKRGVDEIWVIWTVNETAEYKRGPYKQYFHIVETVADTRFYEECESIKRDHPNIKVHVIRHGSPVPLDYLAYFRRSKMRNIVEMGVNDTRAYLQSAGQSIGPEAATNAPT